MKRNPILYVLLAILIAQPLLIVGFGPSTTATVMQPDDVSVPSQGTRLTTHTDHVPIFINGTGDFVAQGWPGAGTSGDPYVIAGLNITYDLGLVGIWIINTDAYFVIRDCYVDQLSSEYGIQLENTSHARLEYVTVKAPDHAIYGMNSNNTHLSHIDGTTTGSSYTLYLRDSNLCTLESSVMVSSGNHGVVLQSCDTFSMSDNTVTSVSTSYAVYAINSEYFSSTNDVITEGASMGLSNSNFSTVTGLNTYSWNGIRIINSDNCSISNCDIVAHTGDGLWLDGSHNIIAIGNTIEANEHGLFCESSNNTEFTSNTLDSINDCGVNLDTSHDAVIMNNVMTTIGDDGIYLETSHNTVIMNNEMTTAGEGGIECFNSLDLWIEGNIITDVSDEGVYLADCDNGTLIDNIINGVGPTGIELTSCDGYSVSENEVSDCGNVGININGGAFTDVWLNDISDCDDIGLYVNAHGMFEAWENTMTETDGGIYVANSDETYIRDNDVYSSTAYGMYIQNSDNHTIDDNSFYDCVTTGLSISSVDTSTFSGNQIFAGPEYGIFSADSDYNTFSGNLLTDCGFFFELDENIPQYNHTFTGNEVNAMPVLYTIDEASGSYDGNLYGQIIFVACNDTTITGGTFDRATAPILLYYSLRTAIDGVTSLNNLYGILNEMSDNTTITDCVIDHCYTGLHVKESPFVTILNIDVSNGNTAVDTMSAEFMTISGSTFTNLADSGFYTQTYAMNCSILDSHFYNITNYGIYMDGNSDYWNVTDNLFEHCSYAIYATDTSSDYGWIIGNEIYYSSNKGIYFSNADYYDIQNNTILWSGEHALYVTGSAIIQAGWQICYNTFGLSGTNNAYDFQAANVWDDEVDTGNWWDDYSGGLTYPIPGAGAVDNYPMQFLPTEPILNELMDVFYAEGTTGNEISWIPYDNYLKDYTVTIDGALWEEDAVPGIVSPTITVNIDGLAYGTHTLVITVTDIDLNSVSDTVMIHVFDDTVPIINNPPNFEIFYGVTGNEIVWVADDLNPDDYIAMMNGFEYATGSWTSGEVPLNIDGLSVGPHHFTMTVYDLDGNSVSDSVSILVINDATTPTIDSPEDIVFVVESTGNRIIWTPTDDYPDSFEIEFNGTIMVSGDWSGGRIIFELDNLAVGDYNFTVTVFDGGQQSASDMVFVQVIPYTGWTPGLPPFDYTLIIIAGVGITAVVVVIGVVYFLKFKKPSSGGA